LSRSRSAGHARGSRPGELSEAHFPRDFSRLCHGAGGGRRQSSTVAQSAAAHSAIQKASPEIAADRTICKTFTANIGDGGEQAIANALVANPLVSAKLAHEIGPALTDTTLHADLVAQVQVSIDYAEARYHVPDEG
jgi:hypothetical protein